ncbi:Vacuolar protein sorting-associated protein 52-like protein [Fragariocoptes setiger]|uniref:Vacuolar protein sorting-associated protein 52 homolog n=1 Tax=Fragariocoptes setiger TaxID=1670756 RepID=A0ABQ7S9H7_9ACAR|nr:Vacuolar protein sorting-associated protein 52-like protein [Fragariocoptes setiger]
MSALQPDVHRLFRGLDIKIEAPIKAHLDQMRDLPSDIPSLKQELETRRQNIEKKLKHVEHACIADYMKEGNNISDLHQRVICCDQILERLETMLCKFQADLGNICQDILSLQDQSVSLSTQLQNKRAVREKLGQFIDDMTIPQPVINHIMNAPTNEALFMEHLQILDQKINFFKEQDFRDAKACNDIHETLMSLKSRAVSKVREYILKKIQGCKKCLSNYQIPQNSLLKNKFFYRFLLTHEREKAREIQAEYVDTMSKVYFSYFKEYLARISKLDYDDKPDEHDLMGGDDQSSRPKSNLTLFQSKPTSIKNRSTVFSMGQRASVINTDLEAPLILPTMQQKSDTKYPSECLFRSIQYAIVDNACREYQFLCEFFMVSDGQAADLFHSVFGKTLAIVHAYVVEQFKMSYDTIAMFLCLHVIYRYRRLALKQNVPVLESYWDSLVKCLWPRFDKVFRMHIDSVKNCDPQRIGPVDTLPHPVTRRYAEYACSMAAVNNTFPDERVMFLLSSLQNEVKNFILRTAAIFVHPKEQLIFMINNYDHILSVFKRAVGKEDNSKDIEDIKLLISKRTQEIVEELLYPHFGSIICFVKDSEVYLERNDQESLKRNEPKVTTLVKSFNSDWRKALDEISHEIMGSFSNFENGNNIQQAVLTQIIQYYHRLQKIVALSPFKNNPVRNELIDTHQLMVDLKKYKTNF